MKASYHDILKAAGRAPLWWDEDGVPRFEPFCPDLSPDIYANEVALVLIRCQNCGQDFQVGFSMSDLKRYGFHKAGESECVTLRDQIIAKILHYGDPPRAFLDEENCCASGSTMNSMPIKVLEYWCRNMDRKIKPEELWFKWRRCADAEIDIRPDWVTGLEAERAGKGDPQD